MRYYFEVDCVSENSAQATLDSLSKFVSHDVLASGNKAMFKLPEGKIGKNTKYIVKVTVEFVKNGEY